MFTSQPGKGGFLQRFEPYILLFSQAGQCMAQNDTFAKVQMPEYCVLLSKGNDKMPAMFVGEELSSVGKNETKCHN